MNIIFYKMYCLYWIVIYAWKLNFLSNSYNLYNVSYYRKSPSHIITYMITRPPQGETHTQLNDFPKWCCNDIRLSILSSSSLLLKKPWNPWEDWGKGSHARIRMGIRLYFTCTQVKAWDSGKVCLCSWWGWILFLKRP